MPEQNQDLHGSVTHQCPVALLLIDVINDLEWEDAEKIEPFARQIAPVLAELKKRAKAANIPVVYVNDNFGQWRSDFKLLVKHVLEDDVRGEFLARELRPDEDDYFILKPKHSGFFSSSLDILLRYLGTKTVVLGGLAGDICVLFTANDAYMRDLKILVPCDGLASNLEEENERALKVMEKVLKADTRAAREIDFDTLLKSHAEN